ncbi:ribosomal protein S2, flavodoxin-like domain-containing protein [Scheffersomyces xylosifermentans]|uniref:ribosomal protein S2, flavodoxin-like domain-containing protein n=1 Tax=Scheffersomyces xylosifermentans TaxID=1304137 RepID=UPI00315D4C02
MMVVRLTGPYGAFARLSSRSVYGSYRRLYSVTAQQESIEQQLTQKELREKAIADALAREEEEYAKTKALRELNTQTVDLITSLNKVPSTLINSRLLKLQQDLDNLPKDKVKQLDEELEEFMISHMKLPYGEVYTRPWAQTPKDSSSGSISSNKDEVISQKLVSTTSSSYSTQFPNLKPTPDYRAYSEQELFLRQLAHSRQSGNLGSKLSNVYRPKDEVRNPSKIQDVTIASLMAAGCHLGHSKAMWRPSTQPYIYGEYDGIHLIDLNETMAALKRACNVTKGISKKGGIILFVGTSKNAFQNRALEEAANRCKGYYVTKRWIPGMITNYTEVTKQIKGSTKIEIDMANKPTGRNLGEEENQLVKPDLVIILNPVENRNCINECILSRVPTIGLCDTDMEPSLLTYPVPCNDDSVRSVSLMAGILSNSAEEGLIERLEEVSAYDQAKIRVGSLPKGQSRSIRASAN